MGDFTFEFKESFRKLSFEIRERVFEAVIWCRDTYLNKDVVRATIDALLVLFAMFGIDRLIGHPVGLRMMYILPIWLAAKRGDKISGYITVAATAVVMTFVDLHTQTSAANMLAFNSVLRLLILAGLMAFIEHFESSLRKYARMAKRDALTQALNRLGLDEYLSKAIDRSLGSGSQLTLAMIDCDKFKQLNDDHGHEYGDHVLKTLARLLRKYAQGGVVARNGGDEFILILPGKSPSDAKAILDRVNWKFREATIIADRCASFTYGISRLGVDGTTIQTLMVAADKNMYMRKASLNQSAIVEDLSVTLRSA